MSDRAAKVAFFGPGGLPNSLVMIDYSADAWNGVIGGNQ